MKYYKIVSVHKGNKRLIRKSAMSHCLSKRTIRYYPYKNTKPKIAGTKLLIFKKLADAQRFVEKNNFLNYRTPIELWECEATNVQKIEKILWPRRAGVVTNHHLTKIWSQIINDTAGELYSDSIAFRFVPIGTFACDVVKLTKKLLDNDTWPSPFRISV